MRARALLRAFPCLALLALAAAPSARASSFYMEGGLGMGDMLQADTFFGSAPSRSGLGLAMCGGLFFNFMSDSIVEFHLGIIDRVTITSPELLSWTVNAPYGSARLQLSLLYFGAGVAPIVQRRIATRAGLSNLNVVDSTLAYLGEAGFLWSVTPKFSLALSTTMEFVSSSGTLSPAPIIAVGAAMRIYFGFSGPGAGRAQSSNEFKGWRYPFGIPMK
jgi:hypothetical protein